MSKTRTKTEMIDAAPVIVKFGGVDYEIHPKKIKDDIAWRRQCGKLAAIFGETLAGFEKYGTNPPVGEVLMALMPEIATRGMDELVVLLKLYEPGVPSEVIDSASWEEKMTAAGEVFKIVNPFIMRLLMTFKTIGAAFL